MKPCFLEELSSMNPCDWLFPTSRTIFSFGPLRLFDQLRLYHYLGHFSLYFSVWTVVTVLSKSCWCVRFGIPHIQTVSTTYDSSWFTTSNVCSRSRNIICDPIHPVVSVGSCVHFNINPAHICFMNSLSISQSLLPSVLFYGQSINQWLNVLEGTDQIIKF